jgi:tetratricopeptide (TPR) repeat protein
MIRVALAALGLAVFSLAAQAAGLDHLQAAQTAEKNGNVDEAVHLYSQAITAGDLTPDNLVAARKGRAGAYVGKSLVADTFQRPDDAKRLRDNAIEDYTAALKIKPDDSELYVWRGQAEQLNEQNDQAVADFSAALKIKETATTLMQRAGSYIAKADYDHAIADLTAAGEKDAKAEGLEGWEAVNERAYAQFLAGRFKEAADDFSKTLMLGLPTHEGDVLWGPYQAAWLHIARARAGQDDAEELGRYAAKLDLKNWPGTLVAYFLGQLKADQVSPPSSHGSAMGRARDCNLSFFTGEDALSKGNSADAARLLAHAREVCSVHSMHYLVAGVDLKRTGK